jgi:hypothetical protein
VPPSARQGRAVAWAWGLGVKPIAMAIAIVIAHSFILISNDAGEYAIQWTRSSLACSLKYEVPLEATFSMSFVFCEDDTRRHSPFTIIYSTFTPMPPRLRTVYCRPVDCRVSTLSPGTCFLCCLIMFDALFAYY